MDPAWLCSCVSPQGSAQTWSSYLVRAGTWTLRAQAEIMQPVCVCVDTVWMWECVWVVSTLIGMLGMFTQIHRSSCGNLQEKATLMKLVELSAAARRQAESEMEIRQIEKLQDHVDHHIWHSSSAVQQHCTAKETLQLLSVLLMKCLCRSVGRSTTSKLCISCQKAFTNTLCTLSHLLSPSGKSELHLLYFLFPLTSLYMTQVQLSYCAFILHVLTYVQLCDVLVESNLV